MQSHYHISRKEGLGKGGSPAAIRRKPLLQSVLINTSNLEAEFLGFGLGILVYLNGGFCKEGRVCSGSLVVVAVEG